MIEYAEDISLALATALASNEMHTLVIKAEIGLMPGIDLLSIGGVDIRERFMKAVTS